MSNLKALEKRLQHEFANQSLLEEALTHASASVHRGAPDYERLEFLGDRVLGLVIAEWLFRTFPQDPEGLLARRHSNLVCRTTLADVAQKVGLDPHIRLARGERKTGGQTKASVLANCCEALIAALYLDGGLTAAQRFIHAYWETTLHRSDTAWKDHKSVLQELAQGRGLPAPQYTVVSQSGLAHQPVFVMSVAIETLGQSQAEGNNKQEAAQKAAGNLLAQLEQSGKLNG